MHESCSHHPGGDAARTFTSLAQLHADRLGDIVDAPGLSSLRRANKNESPDVLIGEAAECVVLLDALLKSAVTDLGKAAELLMRSGMSVDRDHILVDVYHWLNQSKRLTYMLNVILGGAYDTVDQVSLISIPSPLN